MNEPWERDVIEKTLLAAVTEQRRARRWAIFFRLTWPSSCWSPCRCLPAGSATAMTACRPVAGRTPP